MKDNIQLTHISEDRHQYFCRPRKFICKTERELDRHIVHYAKHKQLREKLEMSSEFTKEEDYQVIRKLIGSSRVRETVPSNGLSEAVGLPHAPSVRFYWH